MRHFMRFLLLSLVLLSLGSGRAWAHHISGYVYCDENFSGAIDAGDRLLDGVLVRTTSLTAQPGATYTDTTGDNTPVVAGGPGFYYIVLPGRSDDVEVDIVSGLPVGATVIVPAAGLYASLPIITGNSTTDHQDDVNFLADGCQLCGNGVTGPGEECDDGNTADGDGCSAECTKEFCGDESVQPELGETCEPGGTPPQNGNACREDCTYCGDGNVDASEKCDDGNTVDGDACRNDCTYCGDGRIDTQEQCDDGNTVDGDGCSATCTDEPYCGDGIVQPELGEQCELPNTPGCDADCHPAEICNDLEDNDGDGDIDCFDLECECLPIGRDPGAIRFGKPPLGDLFAVHGSLKPATALDPTVDAVSLLLVNANGKVFEITIPPGTVRRIGRNLFRFKDRTAQRNRNGLARFDLRYFPNRDQFTFVVKAYGDLSKATEAAMGVQLLIDTDAFKNESVWAKTPRGWLLTLPGE
jgi:cysteine-rich repeat protein